jgi:tetratricopeptide (TPR) repeat protein
MAAEHHPKTEVTTKTEARKRLETNLLADKLGQFLEGIKQGPSRSTWIVLGVIALVVALFFTWRWFVHSSDEANSAAWLDFLGMVDPEKLQDLEDKAAQQVSPFERMERLQTLRLEQYIEQHKDTGPARDARFLLARLRLLHGLRDLGDFNRRLSALDNLRKAAELYEKLVAESGDTPSLQQEALLNAGKARESLGDYEQAKAHYETLCKEHEKSAAGQEAARCRDRLNDPANQADLEALAKELLRKPEIPSPPVGGLPPGHP